MVVGRSNIVGKPMAQLLLRESCTVTIAHSRTRDLADVCRRADILSPRWAAAHDPGDWIKPGATVIDVGINRIEEDGPHPAGRRCGFRQRRRGCRSDHAGAGGVGPMTIACLLANTLTACCRANRLAEPDGLTV